MQSSHQLINHCTALHTVNSSLFTVHYYLFTDKPFALACHRSTQNERHRTNRLMNSADTNCRPTGERPIYRPSRRRHNLRALECLRVIRTQTPKRSAWRCCGCKSYYSTGERRRRRFYRLHRSQHTRACRSVSQTARRGTTRPNCDADTHTLFVVLKTAKSDLPSPSKSPTVGLSLAAPN